MTGKRRYLCTGCRTESKLLDNGEPDTVRTGCPMCDSIQRYVAYGTAVFHQLVNGGQTRA